MTRKRGVALDRRRLLTSGAALAAACVLPACLKSQSASSRRFAIGHTGITWGYAPENAEQAITDVAELGYQGFESFGSVIEYWEQRGGIGALLDAARLPLIGAYCPMILTDPARRADEIEKIRRWGALIRKYGGTIAVIGPDNVDRATFDFAGSRTAIVAALDDIGLALNDVGIVGALHQHTGSCITTRDETYAVMDAVNTDHVKLCPDTGELTNGGIDAVEAVRDFLPVIAHVHIKDFDGGEYNDGYCPVGTGIVDVAGVMDVLESADQDFMIMAELNPNGGGLPAPPRELARTSRSAFEALGYRFDDR